jgi:plastocyanin domain-containing protein
MSATELAVIVTAVLGIVWVNWYFFRAPTRAAAAATALDGAQQVHVVVRGGYEPAVIHVRKGQPVRLVFDRQETSGCSEEIVLPDFGVRRFLPAFEQTVIELTPSAAGTYEFTCGMSMLRGKLVVED